MKKTLLILLLAGALVLPSMAMAQESASAGFSLDDGLSGDSSGGGDDDRSHIPWIERWAPEAGMFELGLYMGLLAPNTDHELVDTDLGPARLNHERLDPAFDIGLRAGYYPLSWLGVELEGGPMWAQTTRDGNAATLYTVRGHLLAQLPMYTIAPFITLGGGVLGISSEDYALGDDLDPAMHIGVGAKLFINRDWNVRIDLRDIPTRALGVDESTHHFEALLGVAYTLGRADKEPPAPADTDGDGFVDDKDACPNEAGVEPDGCPVRDADGDGILDPDDACLNEAGVANDDKTKHGCPLPNDRDGDGVPDDSDKCPDVAAKTADGCPGDRDGDGMPDDKDKCPDEPETKNGFKDKDGCPDEVPDDVKEFSGVIKGIYFDSNKSVVKEASFKTLKKAVRVLREYKEIRLEISGHTDSSGKAARNQELSKERADAVKAFLVERGIEESRLTTLGAGPDKPIEDNATKEGRALNRRIEFKRLE